MVSTEKKKIIGLIYDNIKGKLIDICFNKLNNSSSLIIPNFQITNIYNLPLIEIITKIKFIVTILIILI